MLLLLLVSIASILSLFFLFHCCFHSFPPFSTASLNRNFKYKYMPLWYIKMLQIHLNWSLIRTRFHPLGYRFGHSRGKKSLHCNVFESLSTSSGWIFNWLKLCQSKVLYKPGFEWCLYVYVLKKTLRTQDVNLCM